MSLTYSNNVLKERVNSSFHKESVGNHTSIMVNTFQYDKNGGSVNNVSIIKSTQSISFEKYLIMVQYIYC